VASGVVDVQRVGGSIGNQRSGTRMMLGYLVTFALFETLYFTFIVCIMTNMLAGPSKYSGQLLFLGRARLPTTPRSYASSSKGKSPRKQFDPVIFTGIQPTGLSALHQRFYLLII
jgi:hypothetical protein